MASKKINEIIQKNSNFKLLTTQFRKSNLLRHHLVSWPLANYTDYLGDLTKSDTYKHIHKYETNNNRISNSPRYIHADEKQLFELTKSIYNKNIYNFIPKNNNHDEKIKIKKIKNKKAIKVNILKRKSKTREKLKIALANMHVDEKSIHDACRKDRIPNISYERQKNLYQILNAANEEKADVLLLPELSIPVSWLPFMAAHARRKQIALIFGLEHWIIKNKAYNMIIEILPYTSGNLYKSSYILPRVKNHYAPSEIETLNSLGLKSAHPKEKKQIYHLVRWNGISFATYNCFELANIKHRALFRSQLDIMFACVWNKDTNYYQHITESSARDIHCYVAQSNTSHYGGSCVLQPTSNVISNKIYVKGGENTCILTATLDIHGLREAQYREKRQHNDNIKHNPPGFERKKLLKRI